jgi:hypothetical protein
MPYALLSEARRHREEAQQARAVAAHMSLESERALLCRFAEQQEKQAAELEARAKRLSQSPRNPSPLGHGSGTAEGIKDQGPASGDLKPECHGGSEAQG